MSTLASNRAVKRDHLHPNSIDKALGSRLETKRTSAGLSQEQLAQSLGIGVDDVRAFERGTRRISAAHLLALAQTLGVPPVSFFSASEEHSGEAQGKNPPSARPGVRLALPDQGVRLNRAFVAIRNPDLREALITLVTELGRGEDSR